VNLRAHCFKLRTPDDTEPSLRIFTNPISPVASVWVRRRVRAEKLTDFDHAELGRFFAESSHRFVLVHRHGWNVFDHTTLGLFSISLLVRSSMSAASSSARR